MKTTQKVRGSWAIQEASYDDVTHVLTVVTQGTHGKTATLRYGDVPLAVFNNLMASESRGGYFNRYIRNSYPFLGN